MCMTTKTVCGKCGGSGEYRFFTTGKIEACFPCDGSGKVATLARKAARVVVRSASDTAAEMYVGVTEKGVTIRDLKDCGWTLAAICEMLTAAPEMRASFVALGWPV